MFNENIFNECALKSSKVTILNEEVIIKELKTMDRLRYSDMIKKEDTKEEGLAFLIHKGVVREDGATRFTMEESLKIVDGSGRVAFKIINAILEFEKDEEIKKD